METAARESYVTLVMDDAYCIGALVLAASIRQTQTAKELTVLVTHGVSDHMRPLLHGLFDNVVDVQPVANKSPEGNGNLLRCELSTTFTKIYCWKLLQFRKCVFLDADTVVLHNIDELFDREEFSAVPDPNWPDYFNPGVFVFRPNMKTFDALTELATTSGSFDGTDQTLLNQYFADWFTTGIDHRLSYVYNCQCRIPEAIELEFYTSVPAWVKFGGTVRVAHFTGPVKPWHRISAARNCGKAAYAALLATDSDRRTISRTSGMLAYWWSLFLILIRPKLTPDMPGIVGQLAGLDFSDQMCIHHERVDVERMYAWERGEIDYTGRDRFVNILKRLCQSMQSDGHDQDVPVGIDI